MCGGKGGTGAERWRSIREGISLLNGWIKGQMTWNERQRWNETKGACEWRVTSHQSESQGCRMTMIVRR